MKKIIIVLVMALVAGSGWAATNYWDGTIGSWTDTTKWSLGTVPGDTADYAFITGGIAQITPGAAPSGAITQTQLGGASGANIEISTDVEFKDVYMADSGQTATISQTAGNVLFTGNATTHIGRRGIGTYNISAGSLTHTSTTGNDTHTFIGVYDGAVGALNVSGTGSFVKNGDVVQNTIVGYASGSQGTIDLSGSGSFTQDASDGQVYLANNAGSIGKLNIRDNASFSSGYIHVGHNGYGEVNQSGGTFYANCYYLRVGSNNGSEGVVNLSGGTFEKSHSGHMYIGEDAGSVGTVNISGGLLDISDAIISVGRNGVGTINQTGGDIDAGWLITGNGTGSGDYAVSGGSVDVDRYIRILGAGSTMTVSGSDADHIRANRFLLEDNTLNINLDETGSTLIEADGVIDGGNGYYNAYINGTWNIDTLAGFDGTVGSVYDLMWTAEDFLNTEDLNLVNVGATEFEWSIVDNVASDGTAGTGKMLQVTVIPEPATLGLFAFVGGGILLIRRRFMV